VTDADLLLGYLDAEFFLGGRMRLDRAAAERAVSEHVARPLGLDVTAAAWGIHRVVNENMAAAARIHGIERGRDLRAYRRASSFPPARAPCRRGACWRRRSPSTSCARSARGWTPPTGTR
jgi:N-methylhydantoinase A/oxoprolinase/acetone carboxylase beta subunit